MITKKMKCPICKTKTAIYEKDIQKWKCHICGNLFDENKIEILGNFTINQGKDTRGIRYIEITADEENVSIEKKMGRVFVKVFEEV
ncbi:MAG: hypothetical protein ACTSRZ_21440 [Promethearchaeota archaeon]